MKYQVTIPELVYTTFAVEAETPEQAVKQWSDGRFVDTHTDRTFASSARVCIDGAETVLGPLVVESGTNKVVIGMEVLE